MPTRVIREGILDSERINQLTMGAELFYRRFMSVVDDYGRFSADPRLIRAHSYPLKTDDVSVSQVSGWIAECCLGTDPLIVMYDVDGKKYLEIRDFGQRIREGYKSKYPAPVDGLTIREALAQQCAAERGGNPPQAFLSEAFSSEAFLTPSPTGDGVSSPDLRHQQSPDVTTVVVAVQSKTGLKVVQVDPYDEWFEKTFWPAYPRKVAKAAAKRVGRRKAITDDKRARAMEALKAQLPEMLSRDPQYRPHAATWWNQDRWDEVPETEPKLISSTQRKSKFQEALDSI